MEQTVEKIRQKQPTIRERNAQIARDYKKMAEEGIRYGLIVKKLAEKFQVSEWTIYNAIDVKQLKKEAVNE